MQQRPITDDERAHLERSLGVGEEGAEIRRALGTAYLVIWAISAVAMVVAWQLLAWLIRVATGFDFGWDYEGAGFILAAIVLMTGAATGYVWLRALRGRAPRGSAEEQDLETKHVIEEALEIAAVKRFQEQEHGGLIYFLRTRDDRVFVVYDTESQDLGVDGKEPLDSPFRPMSRLAVARTPAAGIVVSTTFTGEALPLPEVEDLLVDPAEWPDGDAWCDIPWGELEARLSG